MPSNFESINQTHEILGVIPKWYIRFGNVILFFVFSILFFISTQIKYPIYFSSDGLILESQENFIFRSYVSQEFFTKIYQNKNVEISLDSFPEDTYGIIEGKIESIVLPSKVNAKIIVYISIDKTKLNDKIELYNFSRGKCRILIQNESLFNQLLR